MEREEAIDDCTLNGRSGVHRGHSRCQAGSLALNLLRGARNPTTDYLDYSMRQPSRHRHRPPSGISRPNETYRHRFSFLTRSRRIRNDRHYLCAVTRELSRPFHERIGKTFTHGANLQSWSNARVRGSVGNGDDDDCWATLVYSIK